ncbi:MAG TPA: histidinol dehydrogenase, partial [Acidimicrobiales bacterium]
MLTNLDLRGRADPVAGLPRPDPVAEGPVAAVREILAAVRSEGDDAVRRFTERWDGVRLDALRVPPAELHAALARISADVRDALHVAHDAVRAHHRTQLPETVEHVHNGIRIR